MPSSELVVAAESMANNKAEAVTYDCGKCPGYCCSYSQIKPTTEDIERLAKHFNVTANTFKRRYTTALLGEKGKERILAHQKDTIYGTVCGLFDVTTRRCTVYDARPNVCRKYPFSSDCRYYDFISWERQRSNDENSVPLIQLTCKVIEVPQLPWSTKMGIIKRNKSGQDGTHPKERS